MNSDAFEKGVKNIKKKLIFPFILNVNAKANVNSKTISRSIKTRDIYTEKN